MAQEDLVKASGIPYTIVRSTQFFEFMSGLAQEATIGQTVHLSSIHMQPLVPTDNARLGAIRFEEWLNQSLLHS